jgi:hypothetical protein
LFKHRDRHTSPSEVRDDTFHAEQNPVSETGFVIAKERSDCGNLAFEDCLNIEIATPRQARFAMTLFRLNKIRYQRLFSIQKTVSDTWHL